MSACWLIRSLTNAFQAWRACFERDDNDQLCRRFDPEDTEAYHSALDALMASTVKSASHGLEKDYPNLFKEIPLFYNRSEISHALPDAKEVMEKHL